MTGTTGRVPDAGRIASEDPSISPLVPQALDVALLAAFLTVLAVLAVLAVVDAGRRGRSRSLWALVIVATGPLGILAHYVTRPPVVRSRR